ncbi:MAG TPA: protein kinase [Polyangia bacterium]|nr:protein kinase [Polyangia bacterium]
MIGQVLDQRYRVLRKLGEGGMGEVWLAEHINLGRQEALKILQPLLAANPEFVSRFRREARATNRVQHPNIVGVYDFGRLPDGRFYLSMEYADGERLDTVLRGVGRLPVKRALHILAQLSDAVDHAHAHGVIHRDLKPENMILVDHRGQADFLKVLDFGMAKIIAPDYRESQRLTEKGELSGTVPYMAPELCSGESLSDPRTDIYAIGCVAFELLVGEPPFMGNIIDIFNAQMQKKPDAPSKRVPQARFPSSLDAIVLRCLEKDRSRRFQTGKELLLALQQIPGFVARTTSSGQLRRSSVGMVAANLQSGTGTSSSRVPSVTPSDGVAKLAYQAILREVAEALLDAGLDDVQLVVGVASFQELIQELERLDLEAEELERHLADVEQATREREATLRFAIGELVFQRSERHGKSQRDLGYQIGELENRLTTVLAELERAQAEARDKGVALASDRASVLRRLDEISITMDRLVEDVLARHTQTPAVTALARRLASAAAAMKRGLSARRRT